jgi:hypothetical protein
VDVHEESYLPFLFAEKSDNDREVDEVFKRAPGRRIFNKKGEEVSMKVCSRYFVVGLFTKSSKFLGAGTGTTGRICVIYI